MIVKRGDKWCLFSKDGSKQLGCYSTRSGAENREKQVNYFKSKENTKLTSMLDDVVLVGEETVAEFMDDLSNAFTEAFDFFAEHWYLKDVASDWIVIAVCECPDDPTSYFRIAYSRATDGSFTFDDNVEAVEPVVMYQPADAPDGTEQGAESSEPAEVAEVTTTADVATVPAGPIRKKGKKSVAKKAVAVLPTVGGTMSIGTPAQADIATAGQSAEKKKPNKKMAKKPPKGEKGDTKTDPDNDADSEMEALRNSKCKTTLEKRMQLGLTETFDNDVVPLIFESKEPVTESEKKFLRVMEGRGAVGGKINLNNRLYGKPKMRENVNRIDNAIKEGQFIGGEADHPESSPRLLATCTKLLGATYSEDNGDVRVRFGILPTSAGKDVAVLADHGMKIGVSTRSIGFSRNENMSHENPYFTGNEDHDGQEYDHIDEFTLQAFDLVVQPSAGTFLGESMTLESLANEIARIKSQTGQETEMTKEDFAKLTVDQLKNEYPDLYKSVAEDVSATALSALKEEAQTIANVDHVKLLAEVKELSAKNAAIESIVDQLTKERDQVALRSAKRKLVDEKVTGLPFSDARRKYLDVHYVDCDDQKVEAIDTLLTSFDENFGKYLPANTVVAPTKSITEKFAGMDSDIFGSNGFKLTNTVK